MPTPTSRRWLALAMLTAALLAALGCRSAAPRADAAPAPPAPPIGWPDDIRAQPAFDGRSGLPLTWSGIVASACDADAVIIGEMHGHERGLGVAAALFDDIVARRPTTAALALEFFERDEQAALDDYLTGVTTEEEFLKAARRNEGNYPPGHRAMVERARGAQRPVIASNAPRRYVRLARTDGFDKLAALTTTQRRLFAIPDALSQGAYRDRFYELMGGMSATPGHTDAAPDAQQDDTITPMFRSQNVWDATMADSIARAIEQGDRPVVQVVGQFHCDHDGGLVQRLSARRPGIKLLVISMSDAWSRHLDEDDRNRADVVIYVGA